MRDHLHLLNISFSFSAYSFSPALSAACVQHCPIQILKGDFHFISVKIMGTIMAQIQYQSCQFYSPINFSSKLGNMAL